MKFSLWQYLKMWWKGNTPYETVEKIRFDAKQEARKAIERQLEHTVDVQARHILEQLRNGLAYDLRDWALSKQGNMLDKAKLSCTEQLSVMLGEQMRTLVVPQIQRLVEEEVDRRCQQSANRNGKHLTPSSDTPG